MSRSRSDFSQGVTLAAFASALELDSMRQRMPSKRDCSDDDDGACALFEVLCLMLLRGINGPIGEVNRLSFF